MSHFVWVYLKNPIQTSWNSWIVTRGEAFIDQVKLASSVKSKRLQLCERRCDSCRVDFGVMYVRHRQSIYLVFCPRKRAYGIWGPVFGICELVLENSWPGRPGGHVRPSQAESKESRRWQACLWIVHSRKSCCWAKGHITENTSCRKIVVW